MPSQHSVIHGTPIHPNPSPNPTSVTCAQAGLAHRAAQRWRDRQNGRGPARPAVPVASRSCRPGQGSRGGGAAELAAVQAAGGIRSESGDLPRRRESAVYWPGRACRSRVFGWGGGACNRTKRAPTGAVTASACDRWEERRPCGTGLIASDHALVRARIRVGTTAPTHNPGYPPRQIGQIAPTAAIRCGRGGAITISRIGMQAGCHGSRYEIFKYINNNARVKIQ